ncbi:MAG TPA: DUF4416 family protein [candidate division Zixibacteria bacterium]|nr:DUF4416 family protein [candidate division Zixibacteria bacterium]
MGAPREPDPVKYFAALLYSDAGLFEAVARELETIFGCVEAVSEPLPWNVSTYYEREMGPNLVRRFVSFAPLGSPDRLAGFKLSAQVIEERHGELRDGIVRRRVNVDPGYLEAGKIVLASTKNAGHRVYLGSGIFAEATLIYRGGAFQPQPHTYRDYAWAPTLAFFAAVRAAYLKQLRERKR